MEDTAALKRLQLLIKEKGALKIINHFHACTDDLVTDADVARAGPDSELAATCAAYAAANGHAPGMAGGYQSVGHYRLHDVKRIEEGHKPGIYAAYADDDLGTVTVGTPSALLDRLTEHERG